MLKESLLMTGKILGLFSNTLATFHKCSLLNRDNLTHATQMESSLKRKTFSSFFSVFLKCRENFQHFQKKMTLIADVFWMLRTWKMVVR